MPDSNVDLSLIIPAYNEEAFIELCLASISRCLSMSGVGYEVVVVNNGSTDRTFDIASSDSSVKVISIERTSVSAARNRGANYSSGRFLAFIDADVILTTDWGAAIAKLIRSPSAPAITGCKYGIRSDPGYIEKYWFDNIENWYINGGNLIVTRAAFLKLGGFSEFLKTGEDVDFCERAIGSNLRFEVHAGFKVIHMGYPQGLWEFMKRELWHGEGDFKNIKSFLSSKIALVASAYVMAQLMILITLINGAALWSAGGLLLLVFTNLLITSIRFQGCSWWVKLHNAPLNYVYFMSRSISLVRAICHRHRIY